MQNNNPSNTPAENKMGVQPVGRLLAGMAVPMMISMLVQALYNVVDSIFVSRLSENALTAVSLAFPLQNLMIAVCAGTTVGMNALLSLFDASENMLAIGTPALRIIALSFVPAGFCIITASVCQAIGNPIYSLVSSVCRQLVVLLPVAWLLSQTGNLTLVWLAFPIAELMSLTLSAIFWSLLVLLSLALAWVVTVPLFQA